MFFPDKEYKLTPRQNLIETMKADGKPERFVNQYDFMGFCFWPYTIDSMPPEKGVLDKVNPWGIHYSYREDQPGAFPDDRPEKLVIKDFEEWQDYVKAPSVKYPEEAWENSIVEMEKVPRDIVYCSAFVAPGIFEQIHNLGSMTEALAAFYEYPDEIKELIKYLEEWELQAADEIIDHLHPDMLLHHDDWGSRTSTFMSPAMFEEFLLEPYKNIYKHWHERGCEVIVHHSDSFGATMVPDMIEMGIDVWQGVMSSNDIPELCKKYAGQITFMGGLDGADIEKADWNDAWVKDQVKALCEANEPHSFIPCITQGLPMSTYDGLYDSISKAIFECSEEMPEKFA